MGTKFFKNDLSGYKNFFFFFFFPIKFNITFLRNNFCRKALFYKLLFVLNNFSKGNYVTNFKAMLFGIQ